MKERNIASCKDEKERYEKKMRGELKIKLNRCSGCKVLHYCSRVSNWSFRIIDSMSCHMFCYWRFYTLCES